MDEDCSFLPFGKLRASFWSETSGFRGFTAGFFRVFKPHLLRKRLEGVELVHTSIIEQIFWNYKWVAAHAAVPGAESMELLFSLHRQQCDIVVLFAVCDMRIESSHDVLNARLCRWGRGYGCFDQTRLGELFLGGTERIGDAVCIEQ